MKIIAIGRNYVAHIHELHNEIPEEPVIFLKPDTAVLRPGQVFYLPSHLGAIHYEVELVLKICKEGKFIQEKFAHKYYEEIGIGIDFTARDLQTKLKSKGLPWEKAKAFDHSCPVGNFKSKESFSNLRDINFSLKKNAELVQSGNTALVLYNFEQIISYVSQFFTLKKGDLIFTGTPAGVGPVALGDVLEAYIEEEKMLELLVK